MADDRLPPNTVHLKNGRIVRIDEYVLWNGEVAHTFCLQRLEGDIFSLYMGDPSHGGAMRKGLLSDLLRPLHPKVAQRYLEGCGGDAQMTEESVKALFPRHKVSVS